MRGIVVNCKTGKTKVVDDGKPMPPPPQDLPAVEVDLAVVSEKLKQIDQNTADIAAIRDTLPRS